MQSTSLDLNSQAFASQLPSSAILVQHDTTFFLPECTKYIILPNHKGYAFNTIQSAYDVTQPSGFTL